MTDSNTHPFTVFLHEIADGNIAYNPGTEEDEERHWVFNWKNGGYNFNFVVHDRRDRRGLQIYAKDIQWIGSFVYHHDVEYVEEPCETVRELVSESVEIREEPLDIGVMDKYCPSCSTLHEVKVMPKMDLVIDGKPAQRIFEETCRECGESFVEKKTYNIRRQGEYPKRREELDADELWEFSRRSL